MKKIAICLSGHMRGFAVVASKIREAIDGDFFIATWDKIDVEDSPVDIDDIVKAFDPVDLSIENFDFINEIIIISNFKGLGGQIKNFLQDSKYGKKTCHSKGDK